MGPSRSEARDRGEAVFVGIIRGITKAAELSRHCHRATESIRSAPIPAIGQALPVSVRWRCAPEERPLAAALVSASFSKNAPGCAGTHSHVFEKRGRNLISARP